MVIYVVFAGNKERRMAMSSIKKERMDQQIIAAISGSDDLFSCGLQIEDDYFAREREENLAEQGLIRLRGTPPGRSDKERSIWISDACNRGVHDDRYKKGRDDQDGHLERDTRDGHLWYKSRTFEVI
jgi:hypothetical protein